MGYRSTAILAVSKEARPYLMHFLGKAPGAFALAFSHSDDKIEDFQGEKGSIMFRWDGIKWYEGYNDIDVFVEFMDHMDCEEIKDSEGNECDGVEHYRFVRVGEEYEDIATRGMAFDVYPSVGIEY